eukprot:SM000021S06480  [mRNA]  locus=s21:581463:585817:- [translate_table: standard]
MFADVLNAQLGGILHCAPADPLEHRRVHSNDCERQANKSESNDMQNVTSSPQERAQARGRMASAIRRNTRWSAKKVTPETWPSERNKKQPRQKQRTYPAKMFAGLRTCGTNKLPMDNPPTPPPGALYTSSMPTQARIHEPAPTQTEATASSSMTRAQVSRKGSGSKRIIGMQLFEPSENELVGHYLKGRLEGTLSPQEEDLIPDRNVYGISPYDLQGRHDSYYFHISELGQAYGPQTCRGRDICRKLLRQDMTGRLSRQLQPRMYEYEILTVDGKDHPEQDRILLYKISKAEDRQCGTSPHPEEDVTAEPAQFPRTAEDKCARPSLASSETCRICKVYDISSAVAAQMSTRADARLAIIGDVQLVKDISSPAGIRPCVATCTLAVKEVSVTNANRNLVLQASGSLLWTNTEEGQTSGQMDERATGDYGTRPAASSPPDAFMHGTTERRDQHVASPRLRDRVRRKLKIDCSQDDEDLTDPYNSATDLTSLLAAFSVEVSMDLLCNQLLNIHSPLFGKDIQNIELPAGGPASF